MSKKRRLKTSINKIPTIFYSVGIVLCTFFIFWFSFSDDVLYMRLIFIIFCSIFDVIALVLLCSQVLVMTEIKDGMMHSWVMFVHRQIKLEKIKEIVYYDNAYTFYTKKHRKFAAVNATDPLAGEIVRTVEKYGAKYIEK